MSKSKRVPFDIDEALDSVDLSFKNYTPSEAAIEFFILIRVFFGEDFEVPNPKFHYFIVDMLYGNVKAEDFPYTTEVVEKINVNPARIGIISSRGSAKALTLDSKVYKPDGTTTTIKEVKVGDEVLTRDGSTTTVIGKSEVFNKPVYKVTLLDGRVITMSEDHDNIIWKRAVKKHNGLKMGYMKEEVKTAKEMYENGWTTKRTVTEKNPKGREHKYFIPNITKPVEYPYNKFPIDPYTVGVILGDGSICKTTGYTRVTAEMDDYFDYQLSIPYEFGSPYWKDSVSRAGYKIAFFSIKGIGSLVKEHIGLHGTYDKRVPEKLKYGSIQQRIQVLRGLMDTDGSMEKSGTVSFSNTSKRLIDDVAEIVRSLGGKAAIGEGTTNSKFGKYWKVYIRLPESIVPFRLTRKVAAYKKYYPAWTTKDLRTAIDTIELVLNEPTQCIAVADNSKSFLTDGYTVTHNSTVTTLFYPIVAAIKGELPVTGKLSHMLILSDSQQGGSRDQALIMGNAFEKSAFAKEWFEKIRFTEKEVELVRRGSGPIEDRHMLIKFKGAQAGGIRSGSRNPVTGDRYAVIIADDVIKNEAEAYSETIMKNVTTALTSDALNAMRSKKTQLILINTPFHKGDPVYKMVESGGFMPLVTPICKVIYDGMPREEFEGLWPDMHDYDSVMERYMNAVATSSTREFNQELMLRVANEEDRMIPDELIQWYDRKMILSMLDGYNLYITTDFTTTSEVKSDFSCIAVWAVGHNQDYFLLDLSLKKQGIAEQYNDLFRMVNTWKRGGRNIEVGVEVDGQQRAHLFALKEMMQKKNIYFNFARQKGAPITREGILSKSSGTKHERFRIMVPHFQNKKFWFPNELKNTPDMKEALRQLKYTTYTGFASHDDFNDGISQLGLIDIIVPAEAQGKYTPEYDVDMGIWGDIEAGEGDNYGGSTVF